MYDEKGLINTIILKRFSSGTISKFHLYDENNREMSENWNFGTFLDEKYTFEIVEEVKIPNEVKNALKTLSNYCGNKPCNKCGFHANEGYICGLKNNNPHGNYNKYVGGGEDE